MGGAGSIHRIYSCDRVESRCHQETKVRIEEVLRHVFPLRGNRNIKRQAMRRVQSKQRAGKDGPRPKRDAGNEERSVCVGGRIESQVQELESNYGSLGY